MNTLVLGIPVSLSLL